MEELAFLSGLELGALLRERQITSAELVDATLRRIEALDPASGRSSHVDGERAMAEARASSSRDDRRAFAGVPIAVKANTPGRGHGHGLRRRACSPATAPTTTPISSAACARRAS